MKGYKNAYNTALVRMIVAIIAIVLSVVALFVIHAVFGGNSKLPFLRAIGVAITVFCAVVGVGYGIFTVIYKRKIFSVVSAVGLWLALTMLLVVCLVTWWVVLVISIALLTILLLCIMGVYSKQLVVVPDNASPDYKDYKTRQAEKKQAKEDPEELPEIKSFK